MRKYGYVRAREGAINTTKAWRREEGGRMRDEGLRDGRREQKLTNTLPQINGAKHLDGKIRVDLADELDAVVC